MKEGGVVFQPLRKTKASLERQTGGKLVQVEEELPQRPRGRADGRSAWGCGRAEQKEGWLGGCQQAQRVCHAP